MDASEVEAMFKHLGLTQYEAKALITLFGYGKCTAEKITTIAGVPLPRVYDTMDSLAKRGFISVSKTRPEVFKAVDPKRLYEILAEEERKKTEDRMNDFKSIIPQILKHVSKTSSVSEEEEEVFALLKKRVNLRKDREYFHAIAKKEILCFAGDMSWIKNSEDLIRNTTRIKIKYNVLYCKNGSISETNARKFRRLGAKVKYYADTGEIRCIIIDRKWISLVIKKFKTAVESEYSIININNAMIANVFARYFYALWEKAK
ncbi:MAG: helix-turn-helix domain-containing protein [Candidatus Aenigmarchaeota archaeon]|nr:helix-turn-helix domain-containing protein [Candidatus Aenigmarchaeota archaeon]